jgi:hypothetical protein
MPPKLSRIRYRDLNARQKENFNFMKLSAVLADFGYSTLRLTDDWQGADFIAPHIDGGTYLKVQLKGRAVIDKKYEGKDLYIAFPSGSSWYLYPHDEALREILARTGVGQTKSWRESGAYSFPGLSEAMRAILGPYKIPGAE